MREDQRTGILPIPENMANWRAHKRKWANVVWLVKSRVSMDFWIMMSYAGRRSDEASCSACSERAYREVGCYGCPVDWSYGGIRCLCMDECSLFKHFKRAYEANNVDEALALARKIRDAKWKPRPKRRKK